MPFPIHPHMLRHACGFKLANDGHDTRALQHYLGHKNIQHTVRYTEMAPSLRLKRLGATACGRRQARDGFRFRLNHFGHLAGLALRQHLLNQFDRPL
jgi:integrase